MDIGWAESRETRSAGLWSRSFAGKVLRTCFLGGFILRIRAKGYDQGKGEKEQDRGTDLGGRGGQGGREPETEKGYDETAGCQERPHSEERCSKGLLVP